MKGGRGFTVLELIAVTAVIVILAALLLPAFAKAKKSAESAACRNSTRNLVLGNTRFSTDNDERFMEFQRLNISLNNWCWSWGLKDGRYAVSRDFICETSRGKLTWSLTNGKDDILHSPDDPYPWCYVSIGYNFRYIGGSGALGAGPAFWYLAARSGQIRKPSRTLMFSDNWNHGPMGNALIHDDRGSDMTHAIHDRHGGRAVIGFSDGSCDAWRDVENLWRTLGAKENIFDRN